VRGRTTTCDGRRWIDAGCLAKVIGRGGPD
jgi:hypothetical protein